MQPPSLLALLSTARRRRDASPKSSANLCCKALSRSVTRSRQSLLSDTVCRPVTVCCGLAKYDKKSRLAQREYNYWKKKREKSNTKWCKLLIIIQQSRTEIAALHSTRIAMVVTSFDLGVVRSRCVTNRNCLLSSFIRTHLIITGKRERDSHSADRPSGGLRPPQSRLAASCLI